MKKGTDRTGEQVDRRLGFEMRRNAERRTKGDSKPAVERRADADRRADNRRTRRELRKDP